MKKVFNGPFFKAKGRRGKFTAGNIVFVITFIAHIVVAYGVGTFNER